MACQARVLSYAAEIKAIASGRSLPGRGASDCPTQPNDCDNAMSRRTFVKESVIHAPPERVFAFHELPDAFRRLTPAWERSRIIKAADISQIGAEAIIETRIAGLITRRWVARHTMYDPPRMF